MFSKRVCQTLIEYKEDLSYLFPVMSIPRQKLREAVFQILFSLDGGTDGEEIVDLIMDQLKMTRSGVRLARDYASKVFAMAHELDQMIGAVSQDYAVERISAVERNVLRLALYELKFDDEIPANVAIAEGIRLARKFGTSDGARFVNAILDAVKKSLEPDA